MQIGWSEPRTAIVTGAARGIGLAAAAALVRAGASVAIVDIDGTAGEEAVREVAGDAPGAAAVTRVAFFRCDVSSVGEIEATVAAVAKRFGSVDILVNNAGILDTTALSDLTPDGWDRVMAVNVRSAAFACRAVVPFMERRGWGRIVNVSSMAGRMGGVSTGCAYSVSKAALLGLTMCLARRLAASGITVNAVAPGPIATDLYRGFTDEEARRVEATIPLGHMGRPANVGDAIAFLASDGAEFITGATIDINGGAFTA